MLKLKTLFFLSGFICCATYAGQLSQNQYDELIDQYTTQILASKEIIDNPASTADNETKTKVFCQRLEAYEKIKSLSEENLNLDLAQQMLMASNLFLDKQKQSLLSSGVSDKFFCQNK